MAKIDLETQLTLAAAPIAIPASEPAEAIELAQPSRPGPLALFALRALTTSLLLAGGVLTVLALVAGDSPSDPYPF